jgi:phage shock protein A
MMDNASWYRAMASFCRQRAKMEDENEQFWLAEADGWVKRLSSKSVDTPQKETGNAPTIGYVMNDFGDLGAKLEKLREDATDCELIGRLAIDKNKRDLFRKLAIDLRSLAEDIADLITVKQQAVERDNNQTQIRGKNRHRAHFR